MYDIQWNKQKRALTTIVFLVFLLTVFTIPSIPNASNPPYMPLYIWLYNLNDTIYMITAVRSSWHGSLIIRRGYPKHPYIS